MAIKLTDIKSNNWQLSVDGLGKITEGFEDIKQCIGVILTTPKGSLPMNPYFGSDLFKFIDMPVYDAAPNISAAILEDIGSQETRIEINKITYKIVSSRIYFNLFIKLLQDDSTTEISLFLDKELQISPKPKKGGFSNGFSLGFN